MNSIFILVTQVTVCIGTTKRFCAAKKIHKSLIDVGNDGAQDLEERFIRECRLMSSLNHKNVTEFLGIFYAPPDRLPLLVMERLDTSLANHLSEKVLLITDKESILKDVACGLIYLHGRQPQPIIHRDLTATNILLNLHPQLTAKIGDMGNSRFVDASSRKALTRVPGTLVYMPPEALGETLEGETPCYGTSLDIFSFGHLALYTAIQVRIFVRS